VAALLGFAWPHPEVRGQDSQADARDDKAGRLEEMRQLVRPLRAFKVERGERVPVALRSEPVQRWNDPTREFSDGSLWIWGPSGRPLGAVAVELYPSRERGDAWSYEFVSLATGPIEVEGGEGFDTSGELVIPSRSDGSLGWAPKVPGVEFRDVPGAPLPGRSQAQRMRQSKTIASRFSADETYKDQTYTLRLLPHPIHRYADPSDGLTDGAVFLFVHGTNPEVFLLIEAHGREPKSETWRYGLARLSNAGPTVRLDQKVVWTLPVVTKPAADETYFLARKPRPTPATEARPDGEPRP
jgi:hypothetical protein